MVGQFVTSKAGHDKGRLYVIVREEKDNVYLTDGKALQVGELKKKRKKHIQPTKVVLEKALIEKLVQGELFNIFVEELYVKNRCN